LPHLSRFPSVNHVYNIDHSPNASSNASRHCRSGLQRLMDADKIIKWREPPRRKRGFDFPREAIGQASEAKPFRVVTVFPFPSNRSSKRPAIPRGAGRAYGSRSTEQIEGLPVKDFIMAGGYSIARALTCACIAAGAPSPCRPVRPFWAFCSTTASTKVIEGIPDHRDSFLSDEEKAENSKIMICCSRSKSPVLTLDL
jgi:hypothetical protein